MSINSIANSYLQFSESQGTAGNGGSVKISYENGILTFSESDGDKFTMNASNLSNSDIEMLSTAFNADVKSGSSVKDGLFDFETGDDDSKCDELKSSADAKEQQIKTLSDEIKGIYSETLDEQEKITKEEYLRILGLTESYAEQFMADRAAGKDVQVSDMQSALMSEVENSDYSQKISEVFENLGGAESKIQQMSSLLNELGDIGMQIKEIENGKESSLLGGIAGLFGSDSEEGSFGTESISDAISAADTPVEADPLSYTFSLNSFTQIYQEKLEGHKEQFSMISDFRELDDGIIEMYKEFSNSIGSMAQESINEEDETLSGEIAEENPEKEEEKEEAIAA